MTDEKCPYCESTKRRIQYNKWHVREVYCASCFRCLNMQDVRRKTWMAEMASKEDKIDEFYLGTYKPSVPMPEFKDSEEEESSIEEESG